MTGHGGRRAGAGRKVETLAGIARQLPDDLGAKLLLELRVAVLRMARAKGPYQLAMVKALIQTLRQATEADAATLATEATGEKPKPEPAPGSNDRRT